MLKILIPLSLLLVACSTGTPEAPEAGTAAEEADAAHMEMAHEGHMKMAHEGPMEAAGAMPGGSGDHAMPAHPVTYTCSMHPEVTASEPGSCPKCGMDLVDAATLDAPVEHEHHQ
jgi:hypothetical protein